MALESANADAADNDDDADDEDTSVWLQFLTWHVPFSPNAPRWLQQNADGFGTATHVQSITYKLRQIHKEKC